MLSLIYDQIRNEKVTEFNLDLQRIAVGGVSAGGHISAILAHKARDEGIPLAFQLLCVPVCDLTSVFTPSGELDPNCPYFSYKEMCNVTGLPMERMQFFHNHFLELPRSASYQKVSLYPF